MSKQNYAKAPLSFLDQIELLKSRKLNIPDGEKALSYLKAISYYRLSAYFLPYQKTKDVFNQDVTFNDIVKTYSFDRELRLLVFDCIERVEIAIRTQMIYCMAMHHNNSHWQDDRSLFIKPYYNAIGNLVDPFDNFQATISKAKTARRPEVFIKHYVDNYKSPANPPSWMCLELLTMGELSHLYQGLRNNADKKRIADFFDVHPKVFTSWLHALTYVRNLCAHHSRLWNRDLAIEPAKLLKPIGAWLNQPFQNNRRTFYFISILRYLLMRANEGNRLKEKLQDLFNKYPTVQIQYMGIPSDNDGKIQDWTQEPIWQ